MDNIAQVSADTNWNEEQKMSDKHENRLRDQHDNRKENEEECGYDEIKETFRRGTRPHSTPMTLRWLEDNYETAEGVCIPRSTLYVHYLDFCEENDTNPVNAASFGKIIRQQFPQITTRRLGTRGQSKYHYYGIGVKESSPYYDVMYSAKGVQTLGEGKKDTTKQIVAYSPRSKLGTLLPPFPDVKDLNLAPDLDEQKVVTFIMMYRTHCQRILDTVIRANFDEVQNFLHHFWQGMPPHITPILGTQTLIHLVGACDSILYKAVANVLMPTVLQPFPESLTQVIRKFASQLEDWLTHALSGMPSGLQDLKLDLSRRFSQVLRRQLSVNHLVQAARTVVNSPDVMSQMLSDWLMVDIGGIVQQTLYTMDECVDKESVTTIFNLCTDFEKLLDEQAPLESYVEWLDSMISSCVVKQSSDNQSSSLKSVSRQFLFMWTCFGTRVIRDLTLQSAASFGSFHLLHLMLDDYVLYRIECLQAEHRAKCLLGKAKGEKDYATSSDDVILPDSSKVSMPIGPFITSSVSQYGPSDLFDERMFDYESQSECFTSDEEDDEEDDDESFLRSPFEMLGDVTGHSVQGMSSSYQFAVPSPHPGNFLTNHNMKPSDQNQHQRHQHQIHQQPFPFSSSSHQSEFSLPVPHHDSVYFSQHHRSAIDHSAKSQTLQLQQHSHQQQLQQLQRRPTPQDVTQNHLNNYLSRPAQIIKSPVFSASCEVPGLPAMNHYPGQFPTLGSSKQSHENPNACDSLTLQGKAVVERKAAPYIHHGSVHVSHTQSHLEYNHHGYRAPASTLSAEMSPPFSSSLRSKPDVTSRMEGISGEAVSSPSLIVKEGLWNHSTAVPAPSFIN